jgi:hypothetical protein
MAARCSDRMEQQIVWSAGLNPAQWCLLECPVFEIFFGGARGGGKTDAMLGEWAKHAGLYREHAIGLMIRRTRTELVETIERSKEIYAPLGWDFNETEKRWRAKNGARLRFAYLERDADADQYQALNSWPHLDQAQEYLLASGRPATLVVSGTTGCERATLILHPWDTRSLSTH